MEQELHPLPLFLSNSLPSPKLFTILFSRGTGLVMAWNRFPPGYSPGEEEEILWIKEISSSYLWE